MKQPGFIFAVLTGWLSLVGCAPHVTYAPALDDQSVASSEFLHVVARQPVVTYDQACRALLLMTEGQDQARGFEERTAVLQASGVVRAEWGLSANDVVDRGTLAYMICQACKLPGGINTRLSGWTGVGDRRYALHEAIHRGLIVGGTSEQVLAGGEFVRAIAKADDYLAKRGPGGPQEREISSPRDVQPPAATE